MVSVERPVEQGADVEAYLADGLQAQLVVIVEIVQEPLVNGVEVADEEIVHRTIVAEPRNPLCSVLTMCFCQ
jgi:hypothetical protein